MPDFLTPTITEVIKQVAGQGLGYLLFILACFFIVWLLREHRKVIRENAVALENQYNKRLEEKDKAVAALEKSNTTIALINETNEDLTSALRNLTAAVTGETKLWEFRHNALASMGEEIKRQLSDLSGRVRA